MIKKTWQTICRFLRQPKIQRYLFPADEVADEVFNYNFSVLPNFVPMDAFQHIKNSGKFIKKYDNVDVVVNSNDKGLRMEICP